MHLTYRGDSEHTSEAYAVEAEAGAPDEIEVPLEMIRRGVDEFFGWNFETEEPEALVIAVYCAMEKIRRRLNSKL
jgi:hypothetical protein